MNSSFDENSNNYQSVEELDNHIVINQNDLRAQFDAI